MAQVDQHGTAGYVGARWWEIYDNQFIFNGYNQCCFITVRGGTGVIWGKQHGTEPPQAGHHLSLSIFILNRQELTLGPGNGSLVVESNGDTMGHSSCGNLNSAPAYVWGNSSKLPVGSETPNYVALNRDYFVSANQPASLAWQESSGG